MKQQKVIQKKGCDAWQEQLGVGLVGSWWPKQVFT